MSEMTFHDVTQVKKILQLQNEARAAHAAFAKKLEEADKLVAELRVEHPEMFICEGSLFRINTASHGFDCTASRYWVTRDVDVKELK